MKTYNKITNIPQFYNKKDLMDTVESILIPFYIKLKQINFVLLKTGQSSIVNIYELQKTSRPDITNLLVNLENYLFTLI